MLTSQFHRLWPHAASLRSRRHRPRQPRRLVDAPRLANRHPSPVHRHRNLDPHAGRLALALGLRHVGNHPACLLYSAGRRNALLPAAHASTKENIRDDRLERRQQPELLETHLQRSLDPARRIRRCPSSSRSIALPHPPVTHGVWEQR